MSEEYSQVIRITEEETSHPGFPYAMAKARFEMEPPVLTIDPGAPVCDILRGFTEGLMEQDIYIDGSASTEAYDLKGPVFFSGNTWMDITIDIETDGKRRRLVINPSGWHWEEPTTNYWHTREYLQAHAAHVRAKRRRKIVRKQKRAAIRRKKRGLA